MLLIIDCYFMLITMTTEVVTIMNGPFTLDSYDEYFTVFLTLVFANLHEFGMDTTLSDAFKRIVSKNEFNRNFKDAYVYVRSLLRDTFGVCNVDYAVNHNETLYEICGNIDLYLDCFRSKFKAWFVFMNDEEMVKLHVYDDIITKVIELCEHDENAINDRSLASPSMHAIKVFLNDELVQTELRNHDDSIETLTRYTSIMNTQRLMCQHIGNANEGFSLNTKVGFEEFHAFITDKRNAKHFMHDDSFENMQCFVNMLNEGCFRYIPESLKRYMSNDHTSSMEKYEKIVLSKHGLSQLKI